MDTVVLVFIIISASFSIASLVLSVWAFFLNRGTREILDKLSKDKY